MTQELPKISTPDAILRIKKLIENKQGDPGRLQYISERLQHGKSLFRSDEIYLNQKIEASVIPVQIKKPSEVDEKINSVKRLIALNFGDPGRLRYILQFLQRGKQLYHSDQNYLDSKIEQFHEFTEGKKIKRRVRERKPILETISEEQHEQVPEIINEKPKVEQQDIPEKFQEIEDSILSQESKDSSDLFDLIDESPKIELEIQQEREKISKLKQNHEQIKIQRDELAQLIAYRQEYEIKINHEKEILEKEIKIEQEKVKEKDALVAELIKSQSKLIQSKTEREVLLEQIKVDREKSDKQLESMQKQLEELKEEYEILQREIQERKQNLDRQIKDQKEKNEKLREDSEES